MTDATVASAVAPSLLKVALRRVLAVGAATAVLGGGARLAHDEVRLAGTSQEAGVLRQQLEQRDADAQRAARLALDLAHLREEARALAATRDEALGRVRELEAAVDTTRGEVAAATAERDAARADATRTAEQVREREAALAALTARLEAQLEALAGARAAALQAGARADQLEVTLAATTDDLVRAEARLLALSADLDQRERSLTSLRERLRQTESALEDAEARARRDADRLARLGRAGVNVPRLTGERPMPEVNAVVVNVDAEALPPLVVVHAGQADGLERGDLLVVLRDGQELARLEVDEVRGPYCTARVVRAARGARVRPGDQVRSATR